MVTIEVADYEVLLPQWNAKTQLFLYPFTLTQFSLTQLEQFVVGHMAWVLDRNNDIQNFMNIIIE